MERGNTGGAAGTTGRQRVIHSDLRPSQGAAGPAIRNPSQTRRPEAPESRVIIKMTIAFMSFTVIAIAPARKTGDLGGK